MEQVINIQEGFHCCSEEMTLEWVQGADWKMPCLPQEELAAYWVFELEVGNIQIAVERLNIAPYN